MSHDNPPEAPDAIPPQSERVPVPIADKWSAEEAFADDFSEIEQCIEDARDGFDWLPEYDRQERRVAEGLKSLLKAVELLKDKIKSE